ncbi:J domain-containing protein [Neorhodopirellula pilleata]|uniref:J domain-containing protein n=1 Tax=Neorhodopirellula pilleata TaxID=2714738 RepID=A0A5C5ZY44_9BACT|nr:J domain-containing protein [Neorhodopirellula pilleata]TWT91938.1 hypothetical protein Pla100_49780 [Neorhodopirellula pilleata]
MSDLKWLPGEPMRFFGLDADFDRRDLKRAYGKAIRQYKPETHPAEFGMIREAYERLEKSLRYGQQMQSLAQASQAWEVDDSHQGEPIEDPVPRTSASPEIQPTLTSRSVVPSTPKPDLTLRQLAVVDPVAATAKLDSTVRRSPQDYYIAAVLADAVSTRATPKYLGHLIDGLIAFPDDPGLTSLTSEFLRTEIPDEILSKTIEFVAQKITTPLFYVLTESLWLRLIESSEFGVVKNLLDQCERAIRQDDPAVRTTFQLRLMRSAIWTAPSDWSAQIIHEIETHSASLNYTAQIDLQFLVDLQTLLRSPKRRDPIRQQLLGAVRAACRYDETRSVAQAVQLLSEVARDSTAFRESFPIQNNDEDMAWVSVIESVVDQLEAYQESSSDAASVDENRLAAQSLQLIKDLFPDIGLVVRAVDQAKFRYKSVPMLVWLIVIPVVAALPLIIALSVAFGGNQWAAILTLTGLVFIIVGVVWSFFGWLYPKKLAPRQEQFKQTRLMRDYAKYWRARLFRFSQACGEPIHVQCIRIAQMGRQTNQAGVSDLAIHFIRQDSGLVVFAALQRILK